jgi:hypothetical protein
MKTILILVPDGNVFVVRGPHFGYNRCNRHRYHYYHHYIEGRFVCHTSFCLIMQTVEGRCLFLRVLKNVSGNKSEGRLVLHNSGASNK